VRNLCLNHEYHVDPAGTLVGSIQMPAGVTSGRSCSSASYSLLFLFVNDSSFGYSVIAGESTSALLQRVAYDVAAYGYPSTYDGDTNELALFSTPYGDPITDIGVSYDDTGLEATGIKVAFTFCGRGNVNEGSGSIADVLTVNGKPGSPGTRVVTAPVRGS